MSYSNNWSISGISGLTSLKDCYEWNGITRLRNVPMLLRTDQYASGDGKTGHKLLYPLDTEYAKHIPLHIDGTDISQVSTYGNLRYYAIPGYLINNLNMIGLGGTYTGGYNTEEDGYQHTEMTYDTKRNPSTQKTWNYLDKYPSIIKYRENFSYSREPLTYSDMRQWSNSGYTDVWYSKDRTCVIQPKTSDYDFYLASYTNTGSVSANIKIDSASATPGDDFVVEDYLRYGDVYCWAINLAATITNNYTITASSVSDITFLNMKNNSSFVNPFLQNVLFYKTNSINGTYDFNTSFQDAWTADNFADRMNSHLEDWFLTFIKGGGYQGPVTSYSITNNFKISLSGSFWVPFYTNNYTPVDSTASAEILVNRILYTSGGAETGFNAKNDGIGDVFSNKINAILPITSLSNISSYTITGYSRDISEYAYGYYTVGTNVNPPTSITVQQHYMSGGNRYYRTVDETSYSARLGYFTGSTYDVDPTRREREATRYFMYLGNENYQPFGSVQNSLTCPIIMDSEPILSFERIEDTRQPSAPVTSYCYRVYNAHEVATRDNTGGTIRFLFFTGDNVPHVVQITMPSGSTSTYVTKDINGNSLGGQLYWDLPANGGVTAGCLVFAPSGEQWGSWTGFNSVGLAPLSASVSYFARRSGRIYYKTGWNISGGYIYGKLTTIYTQDGSTYTIKDSSPRHSNNEISESIEVVDMESQEHPVNVLYSKLEWGYSSDRLEYVAEHGTIPITPIFKQQPVGGGARLQAGWYPGGSGETFYGKMSITASIDGVVSTRTDSTVQTFSSWHYFSYPIITPTSERDVEIISSRLEWGTSPDNLDHVSEWHE